jgi:L-cysteine desulfidase
MNEHKPPQMIEIIVNGKPVNVPDKEVTGLEIKQAAIAQGLNIQLDFLVFRDLSNGQQVAVKDDEPVKVHHKERFDILCNDDHS